MVTTPTTRINDARGVRWPGFPDRAATRPWWLGELAVIFALAVGYNSIAALARVHVSQALAHGAGLLHVERLLGVSVELRLDHLLAGQPALGRLAALYYDGVHVGGTMIVLAALYLFRPQHYPRLRTALLGTNVIALVVFFAYPVAPPRLLPGRGFVDVVAQSHTIGAWSQHELFEEHANAFASMPSLHVAWAVWVLMVTFACTRRVAPRALVAGHVVVTVVVVLATGNHYLLDVLAGTVAPVACWAAAGAVRRTAGKMEDMATPHGTDLHTCR